MKELLILEYDKLKDEQRERITIRENLFYTAFLVTGGIFSALLTINGLEVGYFALPPILFIICTAYYYNDEIIGRMNRYVRESLGPRLAAASGVPADQVFQWENVMRSTDRTRRRLYQFGANLVLYPGASAVSLAFFVSRRGVLTPAEYLAILICAMITGLMLIQVIHHSDLFSRRGAGVAAAP